MSYSNFQRASDLAKARKEMEEAKAELLKRAEYNAKVREARNKEAKLRGDDKWMLPSVTKKIDKIIEEDSRSFSSKHKKDKKKSKKSKKKRKQVSSESSDSSEEEQKIRRKKKKKHKYSSPSSTSSESEEQDEWVEKKDDSKPLVREDWLSGMSLMSYTKEKEEKKKERKDLDTYNPAKSDRELNPFWKDGGTGVPSFKKPTIDSDEEESHNQRNKASSSKSKTGGWRKKQTEEPKKPKPRTPSPSSGSSSEDEVVSAPPKVETSLNVKTSSAQSVKHDFLTDQQMNELGAKVIKAEIMGNVELAEELKTKLEKAREFRNNFKSQKLDKTAKREENDEIEDILLTRTTENGMSIPLSSKDPYSRPAKKEKRKGKNVETHVDNERVRYFHDDDKYNLKQMFEKEKFTSGKDSDIEFAKIISKHKNPNDDLEDIFSDKVRKEITEGESSRRERDEAIREHHEYQKTLENCDRCFDSSRMEKQLIVAMGKNVYLSLPAHEGLQTGQCLITPMHHVTCATQLDEDVWNEIKDFQKALTRMFESRKLDVVFFETARNLHRKPHMVVHAVPNRDFELLPFYFKKAIQESESDWAVNKQLVDIKKDRDLRRMIPKGLPYFWVHFGTDRGFAHVIEDQHKFPENYAQEIIGGLLNLDARKWRRPRKEQNIISKVKQFADWWKPFDVTK